MATSRSRIKVKKLVVRRSGQSSLPPAKPEAQETPVPQNRNREPVEQERIEQELGGNVIAFDEAAERLGLTKGQFAEAIGISRDALYRPARLESAKNQTRIREALEVVERIAGWTGGERPALSWYRSHAIPAFGGRTAEALVKDGKAALVRDYLDAVAVGSFA
jgi:DNA-binding XRE family transcriptional regulator